MVVHDFDAFWSAGGPDKAQPALLVDADAALSGPISGQRLQAVAWRDSQAFESDGGVQHIKLAKRDFCDSAEPLASTGRPQSLCF